MRIRANCVTVLLSGLARAVLLLHSAAVAIAYSIVGATVLLGLGLRRRPRGSDELVAAEAVDTGYVQCTTTILTECLSRSTVVPYAVAPDSRLHSIELQCVGLNSDSISADRQLAPYISVRAEVVDWRGGSPGLPCPGPPLFETCGLARVASRHPGLLRPLFGRRPRSAGEVEVLGSSPVREGCLPLPTSAAACPCFRRTAAIQQPVEGVNEHLSGPAFGAGPPVTSAGGWCGRETTSAPPSLLLLYHCLRFGTRIPRCIPRWGCPAGPSAEAQTL